MIKLTLLSLLISCVLLTPAIARDTTPKADIVFDEPVLVEHNQYTNSQGHSVHSPAHAKDNQTPVGYSAQCRDGSFSFSQSRRGTCSHHGGVANWH